MKQANSITKAIISLLIINEIYENFKLHTSGSIYNLSPKFLHKLPMRSTSTIINSLFLLELYSIFQIYISLNITDYSRNISNKISQINENAPQILLTKKSIFSIIINWKRIDIWKLLFIDSNKKKQSKISTNCIPELTMDLLKGLSKKVS